MLKEEREHMMRLRERERDILYILFQNSSKVFLCCKTSPKRDERSYKDNKFWQSKERQLERFFCTKFLLVWAVNLAP